MGMRSASDGFLLANSWLLLPIGIFCVARITISLAISLVFFWNTHVKPRMSPYNPKQKYGKWAVVTGCTSGIGEQFVHELASIGMNVVLVSRSQDKLKKQAAETEKLYGVKTKVIACNYLDREAYKLAAKGTEGMEIGLLVNNVGLNTDTGSRRFDEMTVEEVWDMVTVNCGAAALMTRAFLPGMMSRGRGCVLNIGSTSGYIPLPFQALYSATKSYMRLWSIDVDTEIAGSGVSVRCSLPQFVRTGMCKGNNIIYNMPLWTCDPRVYAYNTFLTLDTPDMGGWWIYDFMLWAVCTTKTVLHKDMETPIIYNIVSFLLTISGPVKE